MTAAAPKAPTSGPAGMAATDAAQSTQTPPQAAWLNREQASEYIFRRTGVRISAQALASRATARSNAAGPPYRIWSPAGRVRGGRGRFALYKPADLDAWIETQLQEPSAAAE